ncbi:Scr1 family TA system antitoxin-like transcriptional regulator [Streptomyces sp. NPDC014779]|uniref:Scr1 family TA system antitoxin-like transcriptional regulator n=1 Tax=unclassified Streptomyces TaxID=2593676 RepID=UPI0034108EA0
MNKGSSGSPGAAKAFGRLLRFHRERAKVSMDRLGSETGYSKSQVAMIERGQRKAKGNFVAIADTFLGAQGALLEVADELTASGVAAWFEDYLEEERVAAGVHKYETHVIPGLLQTPDYARAAFESAVPAYDEDEIEPHVAARMARQQLFFRTPPPLVSFVLEKAALTKPLGGKEVLRKCLSYVRECAELRNVTIQVMPEGRETHAGLDGPFTLLETENRQSQLVYVEGQGGRYFLSEQPDVGDAFARYSMLRAQALTPEDSVRLIEQVAREL